MERAAGWRPIDPQDEPDEGLAGGDDPRPNQPRTDGLRGALAALVGAGVLVSAGIVLWAGTPQPQVVLGPAGAEASGLFNQGTDGVAPRTGLSAEPELIVDVQGAVKRPGLHRLADGARVGDAIAAAGGYGAQVDIRGAAERLNLAERITDGMKIYVPARGDPTPQAPQAGGPAGSGNGGGGPGGLINVNTASQAQLETLPGIGPVTAGKIITAREEAVFASVDELLARKVVGPATFEKIKPLITVSPP